MSTNDYYTEDLGDIMQCQTERREVATILNYWNDRGLPETFNSTGAKFAFNRNSGNVFLVNEDYQCAMMNGDKLESFYSTPYNGLEGFISDLLYDNEPEGIHTEDAEYILQMAEDEGVELPEVWQVFADNLEG